MLTVRVRGKGQITLPKEAREAIGIRENDRLLLIMQGDQIIIRPLRREPGYRKFLGVFKGRAHYPGLEAEEAGAEAAMAEEANRGDTPRDR